MSDIEKIVSYANELGENTPIELRWEGAGDCIHPKGILEQLQARTYNNGLVSIKYKATLNIYEAEDAQIFITAQQAMHSIHANASESHQYEIRGGVDVTRGSRVLGQNRAHIMFIRNIMLVGENGESLTREDDGLLGLHKVSLRQRANSLTDRGQLALGMSGRPGLTIGRPTHARRADVQDLFYKFDELVDAAGKGGLSLVGEGTRKANQDYDRSPVMKNNGTNLGNSDTYYLVFQPRA